jgi:hypothetical protein
VFSRIRDHEEIAEKGEDPLTVLKARRTGTFVDDDGELGGAVNRKSSGKEASRKAGDDEYHAQEGEELVEGAFIESMLYFAGGEHSLLVAELFLGTCVLKPLR